MENGMYKFLRLEKTTLFTGPDIANIRPLRRRFWDYYRQILPQVQFESIRARRDVSILDGDMSEPGLGLSEDEVFLLKDTVNIYIHLACSISLRRSLRRIAKSIIDPTLELARIALTSSSLERFVYISTAYSNAHLHYHHQGVDTSVCEQVYPLRTGGGHSTELELSELRASGASDAYRAHNFPFPYAYAKHLTERLLLELFEAERRSELLLIIRPSILGPALKDPYPYYEIRGSAPATNFLAAVVASPSLRVAFSSRFEDPMRQVTLDEIPVDIAVNRIIMHTSHSSSGIVHAVVGAPGRRTFQSLWEKAMLERRLPWHPRVTWLNVDWHSPFLHDIAHASVIIGTSYLFEDTRVDAVWSQMTEEERAIFPLFMRSAEELGDFVKRRGQVRNRLERMFSRKWIPLFLIDFLIGRPIGLKGDV